MRKLFDLMKRDRIIVFSKKLWSKGIFDILVGNFLTKFIVFFGTIFLVRVLSKESFGVLGYIENIYSYVYIFAGMGLANAVLRFVLLSKNTSEELGYYTYSYKKGNIFNVILIVIIIVGSFIYPFPPEFASSRILLPLILLSLPLQYIIDLNLFTFRAKLANRSYAVATFFFCTVLIASRYFSGVLWDINGVISAKIIVSAIFGIILTIFVYRKYFMGSTPFPLENPVRKAVDKYSIQFMITNGVWAIFMLNDIMLLSQFGSNSSIIADYKVAYVLPGNLIILSSAIGMFVAPYFVKNENNFKWVRKNYFLTLFSTCVLIGAAVLVLFVFSKPIISLLYGTEYLNTDGLMKLLLISSFVNSGIRSTTANILAAMGQIRYNMIISFSGVAIQIVMNIFMIPIYGSIGVAITSIVVYSLMSLALTIVFLRKYKQAKTIV